MNAKTISFTLMMGVLGNALFAISFYGGPLAPGIALDFSLLAVFIAGIYGGPFIGFVSGLFVGILPGIMFGPMGMSSWLGLFGLPLGKALTGMTIGFISKFIRLTQRSHSSLAAFPSTLSSYIPEALFTYAYFAYLMPFFLSKGGGFIFLYVILPKALGEVVLLSIITAALIGNQGFSDFTGKFFGRPDDSQRAKASSA